MALADPGSPRRAGMREVAHAAGVSVSTVANVLSRPSIVADGTRQRVEQAMVRLGYVPNGPARVLKGLPSMIVGSVVVDLSNPFYAELNRGMEDRLAEAGCLVLACSTDLRVDKETRLLSLLEEQAVRGVIIAPVDANLTRVRELSRRGTPVVLVDHPRGRADLCAVAVDDVLGGRLAAEHLLSLGHRRLAFLGGAVDTVPVQRRRRAVREALIDAHLNPDDALLDVRIAVHPVPLAQAAAQAAERILAARPRPTAVVCLNDTAALGLLRGMAAAGARVPADISIVGHDDLQFAATLSPGLTTVSRPTYRLGHAAADLLLHEAQPGHTHREILFQPTLVVRASTAAST